MIYKEFKNHLLEDLEKQRDIIIVENTFNRPESLFEISNSDDKLYLKILSRFEMTAIRHVDQLLRALCIKHNITSSLEEYCDISITKDGIKRAVEIRSSINSFNSASIRQFMNKLQRMNSPSCVVFLLKDSVAAQDNLQRFIKRIYDFDPSIDVEAMLFEDFIELLFGKEERILFNMAMMTFKDEMHQAVGYQITEICSSRNRELLKNDLRKELVIFDYASVKAKSSNDLYNSNFNRILNNYISNNLFEVLLGSSDFAYSFLTSEWLYKKYVTLDELDNTFIVAGYLKSIEQLLWEILKLVGKGRIINIHRKGKNELIELSEKNYDTISLSLGALEKFFNDANNNDLFCDIFGNSRRYVVSYLESQISQWREKNRNNYFHKKQLSDVSLIEEIRKKALFLYMLILGSINLSTEQISQLKQ